MHHQKWVSGGTLRARATANGWIEAETKVFCQYQTPQLSVDDVLALEPKVDVSGDRSYWKPAVEFLTRRKQTTYTRAEVPELRVQSTVRTELSHLCSAFHRKTGLVVPPSLREELNAQIEHTCPESARTKSIATPADLATLNHAGVFETTWRHRRERNQIVLL